MNSREDVRAWIWEHRRAWVEAGDGDTLEDAIADWPSRPAWGEDWQVFWDVDLAEVEDYARERIERGV